MATQSDIKTLAVMDASELQEGQHKNVDFDGSKILVSKLQGQVYATSAYCTHYGAPLEKGVLSHDGRVVCPWHGACFNLKTGDIEDSPGLDSLWKFKAEEKDGKILVSASEKEVKSRVGKVVAATKYAQKKQEQKNEKEETVVIVGGGSGGLHAVESLRMNEFMGKIVVLSEEKYAPIDRTKLSKALIDDAEKLQFRTPEVLKNDFGVDFVSGTAVTGVNTKEQKVLTSGESYSYDHLILAPGAKPKKIPIEGKDLENVVTLRHIGDAANINKMITKESEVVIIGTSFIGMEVAMAVLKKEPKSVNMVGVDEIPFEAILGREIGEAIMENMKKAGVKFHMQAEIKSLNPTKDGSAVGSLSLKDQADLPANLVIMGTGVAPATEFLKDTFTLEKDGGIKVDEYLRVEGQKNVYAVGDIAHYPQAPEGQQRRVEHWNVAGQQAREAAHNIAKPHDLVKYDKIPVFWSSVGKGLRYVGTGGGYDDSYTDGSISELKFATYQAKNGKVTAVASMQKDPYVAKASELMRLGLMPSLDEIRGGKNILEINTITA